MRLKDVRENNNLTQRQVADMLKIKQNTYSQYETGTRQVPIDILIVKLPTIELKNKRWAAVNSRTDCRQRPMDFPTP